MSDPNDTNTHGFSLSGGPAEPLPESWARPSTTRRVGRVGDWNNAGYVPSPEAVTFIKGISSAVDLVEALREVVVVRESHR